MNRRSHIAALRNARLMWADAETVPRPTLTSATRVLAEEEDPVPTTLIGTDLLTARRVVLVEPADETDLEFDVVDDEEITATLPADLGVGDFYIWVDTRGGSAVAMLEVVDAITTEDEIFIETEDEETLLTE